MRSYGKLNIGVTAAFVVMVIAGASSGVSAKSTMSAAPSAKVLSTGKALISSKRCNGCHGAALSGNAGFSPSILPSGVLAQYNKKTFEVVLNTGKTNDGGMVSPPMPVYHLPAAQSDAIYAYLKTLK